MSASADRARASSAPADQRAAAAADADYRDHLATRGRHGADFLLRQHSSVQDLVRAGGARRDSLESVDEDSEPVDDSSSDEEGDGAGASAEAELALAQRRRAQTTGGSRGMHQRKSITWNADGSAQRYRRTAL